jgi:uncharacterized membrane protein YqjE
VAESGDARSTPGIGNALGSLVASAINLVRTRLELASVEFAEERERAKEVLVLAVCGLLAGSFALLFASVLVIAYFWDTYRLTAVAGVVAFYVIIAVVIFSRLKQIGQHAHTPFAATLAELENDAAVFKGKSS